ncbi:ABC transporter substrate-binding protein, partial [Candidatus Uhrbacteria bacterium]|nr:ABC transporter substrate-binding protein [Candidatus Uhrbacteria bacterium]
MTIRRTGSFMAGLVLFSLLAGQGCTKGLDPATQAASKRTELVVWGVIDESDVYQGIISDYRALHPYVSVNYRRFRLEEYEDALVNAMAEDRGPDIFLVHNTWVSKYLPKIEPMPLQTSVAYQRVVGTVKKETVYVLETEPSISVRKYKENYPDSVIKDTVRTLNVSTSADQRKLEQRIVAVPVSVDTLGLYVNKDLLNAAGIATVPKDWAGFQSVMPRLVKQDSQGNLLQSGAALGTAYNVERMSDIVSALMMQNGAEMSSDDGTPTFALIPPALSGLRDQPPAYQAVGFYTDFANPG